MNPAAAGLQGLGTDLVNPQIREVGDSAAIRDRAVANDGPIAAGDGEHHRRAGNRVAAGAQGLHLHLTQSARGDGGALDRVIDVCIHKRKRIDRGRLHGEARADRTRDTKTREPFGGQVILKVGSIRTAQSCVKDHDFSNVALVRVAALRPADPAIAQIRW